ncbi:MFS transporter [Nonomuraea dietziae]|uniref:MFS transporter n=1 Tax=Nonomuraea dietziae TaxID=65515 RepID=UPI0033F43B6C
MAADLQAGTTQIAAALTTAILVAALCAPLVGRLLDAYGGRGLMSAGSALGTLAVLAWSRVDSLLQLYAVFVAIGVACSMVLYESAFAVIVSWFDGPARARGRANALLALTVVAGFASSIFLPLTGLLVERHGWRQALVILALIYGVAAIPPARARRAPPSPHQAEARHSRRACRHRQGSHPAAAVLAGLAVGPHRRLLRHRQGPGPARSRGAGPGGRLRLGDGRGGRRLRDRRVGSGRLPSPIVSIDVEVGSAA